MTKSSSPRPLGEAGDELEKQQVKGNVELLEVCDEEEGQAKRDEEHVCEEHMKEEGNQFEMIKGKGKMRRDMKRVHWKDS